MEIWTCSAGETFDGIALAVYGNEKYAAELLWQNPELDDRLVFTGGEKLRLPVIEVPKDPEYPASTAPWRQ